MTNKQALREELSNPAIGNKDHLRKIALALLDELEAKDKRIADLEANNDSATEALLKARRRAVTLPTGYSVRPGHPINEAERGVMIPKDNGPWLSRHDVEHALRVAGIRINGEG